MYAAMPGFAIFFKGKLEKLWLFINAGIVSTVIADILLATTANELYYCSHSLELLFHYGSMLFLLAFYSHIKEL